MKNEQEIVRSVFDAYIRDAKASSTKKDRLTFDMLEKVKNRAIKALEQQPSDDCVSRQEVFETFGDLLGAWGTKALMEMKSAAPTQRWIPVSERLPKEDGEYLLFGKIDEDEENYIFIGEYDSCGEQFGIWQEQFDRTTLGCLGSEFFEYSSVIAWQPLPKPYKEKRGSKVGWSSLENVREKVERGNKNETYYLS